MIRINNLKAKIKSSEKEVLNGLNLTINDGEVHAIMGPNGAGKSTLAKTIMGHYNYDVTGGTIEFNGTIINDLDVASRAKMGIFIAMQDPTIIKGVSNSEFLKNAYEEKYEDHINYFDFIKNMNSSLHDLEFSKDTANRDVNEGFSGGEKKKNEILQMKILKPKFIILDEIDSGLDVDSLKIVCNNINDYLKEFPDTSVLIITHYPRILEYLQPNYVHILKDGIITKTGDINLALEIERDGYEK